MKIRYSSFYSGVLFFLQLLTSYRAAAFGNFNTDYIQDDLSGIVYELSRGVELDPRVLPPDYFGRNVSPLRMVILQDPRTGRKKALQIAKVRDAIEIYIDLKFPNRLEREEVLSRRYRNGKLGFYSTRTLATDIAVVADCLKIDPFVFTSLIATESHFLRNAKSRTGAIGLTQFVDIALTEVSDQLGWRSEWFAREETIRYLNQEVIAECVGPRLYPRTGWIHLWDRPGTEARSVAKNGRPDSRSELSKWRLRGGSRIAKEFARDPKLALVYGAILLKENLSVARFGRGGSCKPPRIPGLEVDSLYIRALMKYNGDTCAIRQKYVKKILRTHYSVLFDIYRNQVL